ncbi:MAG: hypothetical protein NZM07_12305 [Elioraea sp.]|nr:hypothetical protein [Elioraea sp.]
MLRNSSRGTCFIWSRLRELAIIPTRDGGLAKASEAVLPGGAVPPGRKVVHPDLIADEAVREALENVFRIGAMDDAAWLAVLQEAWPRDREPRPEECAVGWELLLGAPEPVRERFLREYAERLRFLTRSGAWRTRDGVLLPGGIVPEDEAEAHRDLLLHPAFAARAGSILAALDIGDMPPDQWREEIHVTGAQVPWLAELDSEAAWVYRRERNLTSFPQYRTLGYLRPVRYPAGLPLLTGMKGEGLVRLSSLLLQRLEGGPTVQHHVGGRGEARTQARYPPIPAPDPSAWLL